MELGRAIERKARQNEASKIAKITGRAGSGWNVELDDGSTHRGIPSPYVASWETDTWVTIVRSGSSWIIIGDAGSAPQSNP